MSIPEILKICAVLYFGVTLVDLLRSRRLKHFLLELLPLIGLLVIDVVMASTKAGYVTFGAGNSPTLVVLILFSCILLCIWARFIFFLLGKLLLLDFVKPPGIFPLPLL